MTKVYLAGPLFTVGERMINSMIAEELRDYLIEVFLPQESEQQKTTAAAIFESDVKGLEWCDAVVACMDGPDPDSGTCWECGWAFGKKAVILYRTDSRSETPFGPYNLMMHQGANIVLDCKGLYVDQIASRIRAALKDLCL